MIAFGHVSLLIYAILLGLGGVLGYFKAKSTISLMAGLGSALLAGVGYGLSLSNPPAGFGVGMGLGVIMTGVFIMRFRKTGTFMPAGLLAILSTSVAIILGLVLLSPVLLST